MSATSRILIEYGTSLRAVCAHSLLEMSLTHWLSNGSVTTTVEPVVCLWYSLPIWTSLEVGRARAGDGMLALAIAIVRARTMMRRSGMDCPRMGVDRSGAGARWFDRAPELSTTNAK